MADTKITALPALGGDAEDASVLPIVEGGTDYKVTAPELRGTKLNTIKGNSGSGLVYNGSSFSLCIPDPASFITSSSALSIKLATDNVKGIASFSGDNFTFSSGAISVKGGGISHQILSGSTGDNIHVSHSGVSINTTDPLSGGGDITTTRTLTVKSSASPSANTIAKLDSNGYANDLIKDLIYFKIVGYGSAVTTGSSVTVMTWRVPPYAASKVMKTCGASVDYTSGSIGVYFFDGAVQKLSTVTTSWASGSVNASSASLVGGALMSIKTDFTTGASASGLDMWFEIADL